MRIVLLARRAKYVLATFLLVPFILPIGNPGVAAGWTPYWQKKTAMACDQAQRFDLSLLFPQYLAHELGGPRLSLKQFAPVGLDRRMAPQDPATYVESVHLPCSGQKYVSSIFQVAFQSVADQSPWEMEICFRRTHEEIPTDPARLYLKCHSGTCVDPVGVGWMEACEKHAAGKSWWWPIRSAYAAPTPAPPGWAVPTADTLSSLGNHDRPGYTMFRIDSAEQLPFDDATNFTFAIWVNGTPVYFDGMPPHKLALALAPDGRLSFEFPLENLVFSGRFGGAERIKVEFRIHSDENELGTLTLEREYEALRNANTVSVTSAEERTAAFNWSGDYRSPQIENKFEIFALSTKSRSTVLSYREKVDRLTGQVDGRPVVGVVRPPLGKNPYYGLALGLLNQNGQIQFTFDKPLATKMCAWSLKQRESRAGRRVIDRQVYRYENLPRPRGTPKLRFCTDIVAR